MHRTYTTSKRKVEVTWQVQPLIQGAVRTWGSASATMPALALASALESQSWLLRTVSASSELLEVMEAASSVSSSSILWIVLPFSSLGSKPTFFDATFSTFGRRLKRRDSLEKIPKTFSKLYKRRIRPNVWATAIAGTYTEGLAISLPRRLLSTDLSWATSAVHHNDCEECRAGGEG